jgi:hypothetical protein
MDAMNAMRKTKFLMAVVLLGGGLSIQPVAAVRAATLDGLVFSAQDRGFGGHKGGQGKGQFREAGRSQLAPPAKGGRAPGQLTEEERRQLHRDLDKANREIYGGRRGG